MRVKAIVMLIMVCAFLSIHAQREMGIGISTLNQRIGWVDLEYNYKYSVQSIHFFFGNSFQNSDKWSVDWELNPQLGFTTLKDHRDDIGQRHGVEFGVVPYLMIAKRWSSFSRIFVAVGIGPMYTTDTPDRQKQGFVFSNNLTLGTRFRLNDGLRMEVRVGVRHQSNANFGVPNRGLNAVTIGTGIFFNP